MVCSFCQWRFNSWSSRRGEERRNAPCTVSSLGRLFLNRFLVLEWRCLSMELADDGGDASGVHG